MIEMELLEANLSILGSPLGYLTEITLKLERYFILNCSLICQFSVLFSSRLSGFLPVVIF
jgi:hypothetical protein